MYLPTTHIGGLPYTGENSIQKAVDLSVECFDIPFLPELSYKADDMFSPIKNPGKLSCLDEFVKRIGDGDYKTVKIQIVGPVTAVLRNWHREYYFHQCRSHIKKIINVLPSNIKEVVAFADEPMLAYIDFDFDYKSLHEEWLTIAKSFGIGTTGIHSCGDLTDMVEIRRFDALFNSEIDIINVDVSKYDITKYPNYRNKKIAWGIDFGKSKSGDKLRFQNIDEIVEYLEEHAQNGDLLTPPCGFGRNYNSHDVEMSIETLKTVQTRLKEL